MQRRLRCSVALLSIAVVALAGCGGGGSSRSGRAALRTSVRGGPVYVAYDDCTKAAERPSRFVIACGTGSAYVRGARYSSYGGEVAAGAGELVSDDCRPDCAQGRFVSYPASFRLSRPVRCGARGRYYSRVVAVITRGAPRGSRTFDYPIAPLSC